MNGISEIFERADIQQVRSFLLNGTEDLHIHTDSYEDRIEKTLKKVREKVRELYSNERDCEKMMAIIFDYVTAVEEVHLEIGLQVGAMLCIQMYSNFKNAMEG